MLFSDFIKLVDDYFFHLRLAAEYALMLCDLFFKRTDVLGTL